MPDFSPPVEFEGHVFASMIAGTSRSNMIGGFPLTTPSLFPKINTRRRDHPRCSASSSGVVKSGSVTFFIHQALAVLFQKPMRAIDPAIFSVMPHAVVLFRRPHRPL